MYCSIVSYVINSLTFRVYIRAIHTSIISFIYKHHTSLHTHSSSIKWWGWIYQCINKIRLTAVRLSHIVLKFVCAQFSELKKHISVLTTGNCLFLSFCKHSCHENQTQINRQIRGTLHQNEYQHASKSKSLFVQFCLQECMHQALFMGLVKSDSSPDFDFKNTF